MNSPMFGSTGGQHPLAIWVDHNETYGPHIIERFISKLQYVTNVVDVGAGQGRDLELVRKFHPKTKTIAIEAGKIFAENLRSKVDEVHVLDIERNEFPIPPGSVDLIIANQVLEHTKEIFWIFDQVTKTLRMGGHFIFGVPNIASLHNRLLLLLGEHPTQYKMCSAHVRPFSKKDTLKFLESCFPQGYRLVDFGGTQFYPLPGPLARITANMFPTMAVSIFFMIQKQREYSGEFASYPARAQFETNFWDGKNNTNSSSRY